MFGYSRGRVRPEEDVLFRVSVCVGQCMIILRMDGWPTAGWDLESKVFRRFGVYSKYNSYQCITMGRGAYHLFTLGVPVRCIAYARVP